MSSVLSVCEKCGAKISAEVPQGVCPACLLETGLGLLYDEDENTTDQEPMPRRKHRTPPVKMLADFGDYELQGEIGRGGQGIVYRARQKSLNRTVALKIIALGHWSTARHLKRFRLEAEAAASLNHPSIVPIHEVGERDGCCYFSMNLIEGGQLDEVVRREAISIRRAAELIAKLARTVHYAHEHGILHRDIKPGNILLDKEGEPHLTDFGLARLVETESTVTRTTEVLGTPSYMAPEQASGNNVALTSATDIYGLGAVLYHLLTGCPPFAAGTTYETVRLVLETEPRQPRLLNPKVDRDLSTICLKCLEKDPQRRYSSALALAEDVERWLRHEPIRALRTGFSTRGKKWLQRNPAAAVAGASLTGLVVAVSAIIWKSDLIRPPPTTGIAVLPFENLSEDKANAYFAEGIQDEILTRLSKIADLKVISRTSTQDYKSAPKNLPEIARQLGVATILEGSVQKAGEAVHISVQLVDGRNDAHIWAESYDRELKNIFGVEREVAETVARQLKARLLPRETNELARVPTKNLQAYDLYLRGRYVTEQAWNLQVDSEKPAADFFKQAIALDPGFALAYAALARAEWGSYVTGDYSPERLAEVQANVEKSLELQPDLVEGHLVRAKIYSYVKHDNVRALAECEPLLQRFPNNAELVIALASGKGKAGDWQAELAGLQRAVELDPRNTKYLRYLADKYMSLRRFSEAEQTYQREIILAPDDWTARFNRALNLINQGRLSEAREATMAMPDTKLMTLTLALKYSDLQLIETYTRDYDAALSAAGKIPALNRVPTQAVPAGDIKKHTDTGFDLLYRGDEVGARQEFIQARDSLEAQRPGHLEDVDFHNADALAEAGLGDRIAALKAARKTVALAPIEDDVHNGSVYLLTLAEVHAHFGEADEAIPLVERLLNLPVTGDIITTAVLRLDPIWDPIRSDPRFQKLVAAPAPK